MTFTACTSFLPFANPPHFEVWTSTDLGATRSYVIDERTGKPAQFATKRSANAALKAVMMPPKRIAA